MLSCSGHYEPAALAGVVKYLNWWPARPIAAAAIARRVSFQLEIAWNFLEAHHHTNLKVCMYITLCRVLCECDGLLDCLGTIVY